MNNEINQKDFKEKAEKVFFEFLDSFHKGESPDPGKYITNNPEIELLLKRKFKMFNLMQTSFNAIKNQSAINNETTFSAIKNFGDFEIISEIGSGGMGKVFLAKQISLNRLVALKVLNPVFLTNSKSLERFKREAETVAKLTHNSIVPIHTFGIEEGNHFISFDFIPGLSLDKIIYLAKKEDFNKLSGNIIRLWIDDYIKKSLTKCDGIANANAILAKFKINEKTDLDKWSYTEFCCRVILQIANVLQYAHSLGIVHRDIKPSNIIITQDGSAQLLDFGITRSLEEGQMDLTTDYLGTIYYSSPEQIISPEKVSPQSDLFSLGITFYELFTLKRPFSGKTVNEIGNSIKNNDQILPRKINSHIPRDLETIIITSLDKSLDKRYKSAEIFAEDIRNFLEYKPIRAKPPSVPTKIIKLVKRHPSISGIICISILFSILWSFQYLLTFGMTAYDRSDFKKAEKIYKTILFFNPFNIKARLELATAFYSDKNLEEALKYYQQVLKRQPDNITALYYIANIYDDQNKLDDAMSFYAEALQKKSDDSDSQQGIADIFVKKYWNGNKIILYLQQYKLDKIVILNILSYTCDNYKRYHCDLEKSKDIQKSKQLLQK